MTDVVASIDEYVMIGAFSSTAVPREEVAGSEEPKEREGKTG
jgi:hypothetical protein